ncbi:peptidoglycan-binding domain-containing protein [Neptuniibacter sp.]|uniref:peptidoglycan-binding domain-containing protein n=1 Tax=Neptuniibacter sp. TaxID=1962643 RepID=UPI0026247E32|nr:peptidoglycan-binding domain-containing protein [Neptuniibacter sp.]MCP4596467.1 peptidoglycan-binding protein [Neptuniibacter sp.]
MSRLVISFVLAFLVLPVRADIWQEHGVIQLSEQDGWSHLQSAAGREFYLQGSELSAEQTRKVVQLVELFSRWQQIQWQRLELVQEGSVINALLTPNKVLFNNRDFTPHLQAGVQFIKQGDVLKYNFRLLDQQVFIKLSGHYESEESLLMAIAEALENQNKHLNIYDPKQLHAQITVLQTEITNLRRTLVALNPEQFCHLERCDEETKIDDRLYSTQRYPGELAETAKIQLSELGYRSGELGQNWSYQAYKALLQFQKDSPLLPVTGELDRLTKIALANPEIAKVNPDRLDMFQLLGDLDLNRFQRVRLTQEVQIALANWAGKPGRFDGRWSSDNLYQYIYFQHAHDLKTSGVFDQDTLHVLLKRSYVQLPEYLNAVVPASEQIRLLNTALFAQGYPSPANGSDWRLATTTALALYQQTAGLAVDGLSNQATMHSLFAGPQSNFVLKVQQALELKGYDPGALDGQWGNRTVTALKQFQAAESLSESGWVDLETKRRLGLYF